MVSSCRGSGYNSFVTAGVLYVTNQFSQESVDRMPSFEVCTDLDDLLWRRNLRMLWAR